MKFFILAFLSAVLVFARGAVAHAQAHGLAEVKESQQRGFFDLHTGMYETIYKVTVNNAAPGEILRIAGRIEASEKNCAYSKLWTYVQVTRPDGVKLRVSPYAWQWVSRKNNHHMPLYVYGSHTASQSGDYEIAVLARATNTEPIFLRKYCSMPGVDPRNQALQDQNVAQSNMWVEFVPKPVVSNGVIVNIDDYYSFCCDYGSIIVERFSPFAAGQSPGNLRGVVDFERRFIFPQATIVGVAEVRDATKGFLAAASDILRFQGLATAQYENGNNIFALELEVDSSRIAVSTENVVNELYRFSLQNDGVVEATQNETIAFEQVVKGIETDQDAYTLPANQREMATLHFSTLGAPKYLKSSDYVTVSNDLYLDLAGENSKTITVAQFESDANPSDIIRVQSQAQIDLLQGAVGSCSARIEIWEYDGVEYVVRYLSLLDQRYVRTDHSSASYSPFALHRLSGSAQGYRVILQARCASSDPNFEVFLKDYGQGLIVDQFGN